MKKAIVLSSIVLLFAFATSCNGEGADVVDSGTYEGTIKKVVPEKDEIYVETEDDKTLELYFTDKTELIRAGEPANFSQLEKGQEVQVKVEKVGKRLDPVSVKIME
ncbi:MAG: hypothetical protein ACOCXV_03060 [Bacteroidota bacterium]